MKILHSADWHLGKKLEGYYRLDEQKEVLNEICGIADIENVDAVLIAGDIFDTYNPPTEAIELFYRTVHRLANNASRLVLVIAGNHDSPDRIEAPEPLAVQNGIFFLGYPDSHLDEISLDSGLKVLVSENGFAEFLLPSCNQNLRVIFTPFANEYRLRKAFESENTEKEFIDMLEQKWKYLAEKYCDENGINILVSHHFFIAKGYKTLESIDEEKPIVFVGGTQAIDISLIPDQIHYTALGHLHRCQTIGSPEKNVSYSGSPLSYSFAESEQKKYVLISDFSDCTSVMVKKIGLISGKMLVRKRFDCVEDTIYWLAENTDKLVDITIKTDTFISSEDRKRMNSIHQGIISIQPEITIVSGFNDAINADTMNQDITSLFNEYFRFKKGVDPDKKIIDLFREIISD
jgi:DNA repair protein SbcD/Mre11